MATKEHARGHHINWYLVRTWVLDGNGMLRLSYGLRTVGSDFGFEVPIEKFVP